MLTCLFWIIYCMSTLPSLPTYVEVTNALKHTSGHYNPSQVHGLMCGLICGTSGKEDQRWETLVGHGMDPKTKEVLLRLYETSYHQMSEFSFEFSLLLPEDKNDINKRAEALGLWCQGYLTGLEQANVPLKNRPPGEITETIEDLLEISQVNYGEIVASEEDEMAYYELIEYVRLAALMIFHELRSNTAPNHSSDSNLSH